MVAADGWVKLIGTRRSDALAQLMIPTLAVELITFIVAVVTSGLVRARAERLAAEVNFDLGKLRSGSHVVDLKDITLAWLDAGRGRGERWTCGWVHRQAYRLSFRCG